MGNPRKKDGEILVPRRETLLTMPAQPGRQKLPRHIEGGRLFDLAR